MDKKFDHLKKFNMKIAGTWVQEEKPKQQQQP
jgi:hypothetical protein